MVIWELFQEFFGLVYSHLVDVLRINYIHEHINIFIIHLKFSFSIFTQSAFHGCNYICRIFMIILISKLHHIEGCSFLKFFLHLFILLASIILGTHDFKERYILFLLSTMNWLLNIRRNVIILDTKVLICLEIDPVLLKTMKMADSLRLGNKEIKICEDGGNTKQFGSEVTIASLSSKHEWIELDPGLWDQNGCLVAANFWSQ